MTTAPRLTHLPADTTPDHLKEVVARDGAAIVDNLMPAELLTRVRNEITPYVDATSTGHDDFTGRRTTRTGALVARSPACRELVMHPLINAACDLFLSPFCDRYQLHLTQVIRIMPEQGEQVLHRDRLAWGGFVPRSIEPQLNTIWAITDFTQTNGATRVVPGSNQWPDERQAHEDEITYAGMTAGSVIVYSGSVIHSGGRNTSDADRVGINITYSLGWLRQEENQFLSCPPHIARELDPELRALLGYSMGSYALGYFSPPTPPGENPEVVPPEFLFNGQIGADWGQDLFSSVTARVASQLGQRD
ncbi:MAG: phytanoyl-CoA dioxygenase family protein [Pseudomonadales bacterium]|nr:phytanoyl-CoA dioxygenase family protein [Pseudomonadales bacterium]MCP5184786.1 phytanoyl-CoA dioxygenase family protein [Pseudomonadales bacterium]